MNEVLKDIAGWFRALLSGKGRTIDFWDVQFVPVDLDGVAKDLQIDELAELNGSKGQPSQDAEEVDFPHKKIANYFSQQLADLHTKAVNRLNLYNSSSGIADMESAGHSIDARPERFQQSAEQRIHDFNDDLAAQRQAIAKADNELEEFKKAHGLTREPQYPENLAVYIGIPLFLLGIDVVFNAAVLKDASPTGEGLKGGILMAFLLALFNVVLAAIFGLLLRFKNSSELQFKVVGYLSGLTLLLYIPGNWFVALMRDRVIALRHQFESMTFDQIVLQRQQILASTFEQMATNPFAFASIESIGLLVVGLMIAIASAIDGYRSGDPVPYYKFYHHRFQRLKEGLVDIKQEFRNEVAEQHKQAEKELERSENDIQEALRRIKNFINARSRLLTVYGDQAADYVKSCDTLIARYRDGNRRIRGEAAVPRYFNEPAQKLRVTSLEEPDSHKEINYSYYEGIARDLQARLDVARKDLHRRWAELQRKVDEATV